MKSTIHVLGAGLAGSEAAYSLASKGHSVLLYEMRPNQMTEAHHTGQFAELVCSNSLKSKVPDSAPGLLKDEMTQLGSLTLQAAEKASIPGGDALTVDREIFSDQITQTLRGHPRIQIIEKEIASPPLNDGELCLIATGPLTSPALCQWIGKATRTQDLYFYDAIAPIVDAHSINRDIAFLANRYDKGGESAYLNCPMTEEEYHRFIDALIRAEKVPPKNFEKEIFFQGCQPIEAIASTGRDTLRYGPMKPVGLDDPRTGKRPYAVVQLRAENASKTAYNLVGFQTKLKYGEQSKVFRLIPGLENAEFLRLGSIHRNTFLCAPEVLRADLSLKGHPRIFFAGQITGVEGYLESAAIGLLVAHLMDQKIRGVPHSAPPATTALGALLRHVTGSDSKHYQPSNIHFGLFHPHLFNGLNGLKKDLARAEMIRQMKSSFRAWVETQKI